MVGGRYAGAGPDFYFVFPAEAIEAALVQLRVGLVVAALIAIALALATAGFIARGILRPVSLGSRAAARIAGGDLSARVPAGGADEFARFAAEFNRMADSLASTVARLERSESQNRRFVADVSHELRTPLTALVAEASIIEAGLADLPPDARRAGELLVADVRRLRALVDDLMELSRFDARAERAELQPVDLVATVRSIVASRLPDAALRVARRAGRRRGGRPPPRPDRRQPARQRAVACARRRGRGDGRARRRGGDRRRSPIAAPASRADALAHLFDRFYKADASRHEGSSGLGLAIAAEHAALLGGGLVAENRRRAAGSRSRSGCRLANRYPRAMGRTWAERNADDGSSAVSAPTEPARPKT